MYKGSHKRCILVPQSAQRPDEMTKSVGGLGGTEELVFILASVFGDVYATGLQPCYAPVLMYVVWFEVGIGYASKKEPLDVGTTLRMTRKNRFPLRRCRVPDLCRGWFIGKQAGRKEGRYRLSKKMDEGIYCGDMISIMTKDVRLELAESL